MSGRPSAASDAVALALLVLALVGVFALCILVGTLA